MARALHQALRDESYYRNYLKYGTAILTADEIAEAKSQQQAAVTEIATLRAQGQSSLGDDIVQSARIYGSMEAQKAIKALQAERGGSRTR